jgi:hypothetical protein
MGCGTQESGPFPDSIGIGDVVADTKSRDFHPVNADPDATISPRSDMWEWLSPARADRQGSSMRTPWGASGVVEPAGDGAGRS